MAKVEKIGVIDGGGDAGELYSFTRDAIRDGRA
jgi:hypothetical protein